MSPMQHGVPARLVSRLSQPTNSNTGFQSEHGLIPGRDVSRKLLVADTAVVAVCAFLWLPVCVHRGVAGRKVRQRLFLSIGQPHQEQIAHAVALRAIHNPVAVG